MTSLDLEEQVERTITLTCADKSFTLTALECKLSELLDTTLTSDPTATEIPILYGKPEHLAECVAFLRRHQGTAPAEILKPLISVKMSDVTNAQDAEQVDALITNNNVYFLYDVMSVANYLHIPALLDLCGAKIASLIKFKPVKDVETILNPEKREIKSH